MKATLARLHRFTADPQSAGDGTLLDAFLAGDQSAFAALVRRHASLVFATCRRVLRHQQDAEDAFQATFLVLARRAADVWPREAVGSWLFGVAHRVALKARAVRSRRAARQQPLEEVPAAEAPGPDCDLAEVIHRVVGKLPEVYRAAVVACDLQGLSRKEAAERLGWSEGTLSGRLARARDLLATRLRRLGLSLPAAGLAALVAAPEAVSAATLQSTIDLATGAAGGASAPVAALTEGVLRSMALFKLKTAAAAVFTACAIGLSVLAAAGAGDNTPSQQTQTQTPATPSTASAPVVAKPTEPPGKALNEKPPARPLTDRDRLQGTWRVVSLTEGGKTTATNPKDPWVIEFSGGTMRMPYRETEGGWKQREYTFSVDDSRVPRTIDFVASQKQVGRGIYEFTGGEKMCSSCHVHPFKLAGEKLSLEVWGLCAPALRDARAMRDAGLRLAISIDGKRPEKFGGEGVIVFELKREGSPDVERARLLEQRTLLAKRLEAKLTATEKMKLEAELHALQAQLDALLAQETEQNARAELRQAQAQLERARAQALVAEAEVAQATANLARAKERLAAAEKALADLQKGQPAPPAKPGEAFTVHVRTLTAAEKVIRVKATGKETVLEALVYAADDITLMTGSVSVWLVRDKAVMPVDLPAITQKGDSKTNYALKPGDQLFVQAKPGK